MRLLIFTPCRTGLLQATTAQSMVGAAAMLTLARIHFEWQIQPGCFVHVMRDTAARGMLESDFTDLVFLDDDIGFAPEGFFEMLTHDVDVVGAICPRRAGAGEAIIGHLDGERRGSLVECAYIGCGLLRIRRAAIEAMARRWGYVFDAPRAGAGVTGEDVNFCSRYRLLGGKVWADPGVMVTHTGPNTWSN